MLIAGNQKPGFAQDGAKNMYSSISKMCQETWIKIARYSYSLVIGIAILFIDMLDGKPGRPV